jgi:hypothetical protein
MRTSCLWMLLAGTTAMMSGAALGGGPLVCNKSQTKCLTETRQLTIGDEVGVFNTEDELVATGEVRAMRGDRRAVVIGERHGQIRKSHKLVLLETKRSDASYTTAYKIYREPANLSVGASGGLSSVSVGESTPAMEFSAYAQWRKWYGLQLVLRGVYTAGEGSVTTYDVEEDKQIQAPISLSGMGILGGVGYVMRENKPLSFRTELAAGGMQMSAAIDGDSALVDDGAYNARVKNGFAAYGRGSFGVMYNMSSWHIHADLVQALTQQAHFSTIAAGVSKDLK